MKTKINITNQTRTAHIDIEGVIGFENENGTVSTYAELESALQQLRTADISDIVVNIRSTGGNVNDALLIYEALLSLDRPVTTRCYGYVASAATIIAQAADSGRREISANALYLIHCSESYCEGNARTVIQTKELLEQTDRRIAEIYASRSGLKAESFLKLMNENNGKGRWLSPEECVAAGLADRIIEAAPISNSAADELKQLNLPPLPGHANGIMAKLTEHWNALLEKLGFSTETAPASVISYPHEIECLSDRIERITNNNTAFHTARKTEVCQTEDPSICEGSRTGNSAAYEADAYNIRNGLTQ